MFRLKLMIRKMGIESHFRAPRETKSPNNRKTKQRKTEIPNYGKRHQRHDEIPVYHLDRHTHNLRIGCQRTLIRSYSVRFFRSSILATFFSEHLKNHSPAASHIMFFAGGGVGSEWPHCVWHPLTHPH